MTKLRGARASLRAVKPPTTASISVAPPPCLPANMRGEFRALVTLLQSRSAWNPALVHSIEHYLSTLSIHRRAMAEVTRNGAFTEDGKATDALKIALQAANVLKAGAAALGLTGLARATGDRPHASEVQNASSPWEVD